MRQFHDGYQMATRWDELLAEYDNLGTQEGQAQFIADCTGFSEDCLRRVLVHVMTQPVFFGEEWDLDAQARNAWLSIEEYGVAMSPLVRMSLGQAQARLRDIETRIAQGEDPVLSEDELEKVRGWEAIVGTIARLSGEEDEVVITILFAVRALNKRQHEIVHELMRLKALRESPSSRAL